MDTTENTTGAGGANAPENAAAKNPAAKKLPAVILRKPAERFGMLSNRLDRKTYLFCMLAFLAGAFGFAMLMLFVLGLADPFNARFDMASAIILTLAGFVAQYKLTLHRRVLEQAEEFPDHAHAEDAKGRTIIPGAAHREAHRLRQPLDEIRRGMSARLRRLRGHAADHLKHRPAGDSLSALEFFCCAALVAGGSFGAYYLRGLLVLGQPIFSFKELAGAITSVVVGLLCAIRLLLYFCYLLLRGGAAQPLPDATENGVSSGATGESTFMIAKPPMVQAENAGDCASPCSENASPGAGDYGGDTSDCRGKSEEPSA